MKNINFILTFRLFSAKSFWVMFPNNLAHFFNYFLISFYCRIMRSDSLIFLHFFIWTLYVMKPCPQNEDAQAQPSRDYKFKIFPRLEHYNTFYKWSLIEIFRTKWNVKNSFFFLVFDSFFTRQYIFILSHIRSSRFSYQKLYKA